MIMIRLEAALYPFWHLQLQRIIRNYDDGLFKHQMMMEPDSSTKPAGGWLERDDLSHPSITPMIIMIMVCCLHYFSIQLNYTAKGLELQAEAPPNVIFFTVVPTNFFVA